MTQTATPTAPPVDNSLESSYERYKKGIIDHADDDLLEVAQVPRTEEQWAKIRASFAARGFN